VLTENKSSGCCFTDLPDPDWNSFRQLQRLYKGIRCLTLPNFVDLKEDTAAWSEAKYSVWNYVGSIIDIDKSNSQFLSRYISLTHWLNAGFPVSHFNYVLIVSVDLLPVNYLSHFIFLSFAVLFEQNPAHVLYHLLPPTVQHHFGLHPRPHNYVLPLKDVKNFLPCHLYNRDMTFFKTISPCHFWLSFYAKMKIRPVAGGNS